MQITVNGTQHLIESGPSWPLLYVLRDRLNLTGAKYGCGEGQCGACTVLLDGVAVRSCITPVTAAIGKQITTIEGLEQNGKLHPVQQSFIATDAMQCGYCTSGMIMSAVSLLKKNPKPTHDEILSAMQGNVCRCGTQPLIVQAIKLAAKDSTHA